MFCTPSRQSDIPWQPKGLEGYITLPARCTKLIYNEKYCDNDFVTFRLDLPTQWYITTILNDITALSQWASPKAVMWSKQEHVLQNGGDVPLCRRGTSVFVKHLLTNHVSPLWTKCDKKLLHSMTYIVGHWMQQVSDGKESKRCTSNFVERGPIKLLSAIGREKTFYSCAATGPPPGLL